MPYSISVSKLRSPVPAGNYIVSHLGFCEDDDDLEHTRDSYNDYKVVAIAHPSYDRSTVLGIIMETPNNQFVTWAIFDWSKFNVTTEYRNLMTRSDYPGTELDNVMSQLKVTMNNIIKSAIDISNGMFGNLGTHRKKKDDKSSKSI
jgi:hypothetical protein